MPVTAHVDGTRTATYDFTPADLADVERRAMAELAGWGLGGGQLRTWLAMARSSVAGSARLVLEYDAAAGLLSCDVWCDGKRAFGADDWVG